MNKETYEALKRIINQRGYHYFNVEGGKNDYKTVENWVDEVAKEYEEYICPNCGTKRENDFPISDETGDKYCPDCNWTLE